MKQGLTCTFILFYRTTDNEITLSHTEQAFQKDPCESFTLIVAFLWEERHEKDIG